MLPNKYRLPVKDFNYIYGKGKKYRGKFGMLVVLKDDSLKNPKVGFVVSKKIGDAPDRHRVTRMLRVIFRDCIKKYSLESKGLKMEYIAFTFIDDFNYLNEDVSNLFERCLKELY